MPHRGSKRLFDTMDSDLISQMDMFWSTHAFGQPRRKMSWSWQTAPTLKDIGPRVTWTTTFGYILNTALTRMGRHDPESGETRPTNDEPVRAPIDGTGDLADYFAPASKPQFSNPTVRSAPSGPEPTNSPEVQEDLSQPWRGGYPMAPPLDISQLQTLFPWTASLPERLQRGLLWDPSVSPYEVQTPGQLLLYTGKKDSQSLDSVLLGLQSSGGDQRITTFSEETSTPGCVSQPGRATFKEQGEVPTAELGAYFGGFQKGGFPKPVRVDKNQTVGGSQSSKPQRPKTRTMTACSYLDSCSYATSPS